MSERKETRNDAELPHGFGDSIFPTFDVDVPIPGGSAILPRSPAASAPGPMQGSMSNDMRNIEIPVKATTAAALSDARRREAVGSLVDRLVRPGADDPLIALFERIAADAQSAGLTEAEIDAELAAYNAERRG